MTPEPPRFPALGAEEAHMRQSLLGALCGLSVDDQLLRAQLLPRGADAAWFRCADAIAFRPLRLGGCALSMDASDGPAMAALLDAADDLLSAVEAVNLRQKQTLFLCPSLSVKNPMVILSCVMVLLVSF